MGLDMNAAALGGWVPAFVRVSNRLAGITRDPTDAEIAAHRGLLAANALQVENLEVFVHHVAPGAALREAPRQDAGSDRTARGPVRDIRDDLATVVAAARTQSAPPERLHRIYRMLRPFTAGNGRCARALWMWQVMRGPPEDLLAIAQLDLADIRHPLNSDTAALSAMM